MEALRQPNCRKDVGGVRLRAFVGYRGDLAALVAGRVINSLVGGGDWAGGLPMGLRLREALTSGWRSYIYTMGTLWRA